jgi:dihydroorotate dehydrogenase
LLVYHRAEEARAGVVMKLRGIEFGNVFNASGARGFNGEGYWFHWPWRWLGLDYTGSTFVAKTTTLMSRAGNMLVDGKGRMRTWLPDCIVVKPFKGVVLNAVGLSGPGILALVEQWQKRLDNEYDEWAPRLQGESLRPPMVVSLMGVLPTAEERLKELRAMIRLLQPLIVSRHRLYDSPRLAVQINFSCPNVGLDPSHLADEITSVLDAAYMPAVPVMVKLNALVPVEVARSISAHEVCDAIVISNTIPWGQLPNYIDWKGLFGSDISPLAKYGGGGLSGKPLLPIVIDWIRAARKAGMGKPIVGGGGILSSEDADSVLDAGANAIELGSVSILRPWRVKRIIRDIDVWFRFKALETHGYEVLESIKRSERES